MGEIGGIKTAWRRYVCIEVKCLDRYTGGKNSIFQEMVYTTQVLKIYLYISALWLYRLWRTAKLELT